MKNNNFYYYYYNKNDQFIFPYILIYKCIFWASTTKMCTFKENYIENSCAICMFEFEENSENFIK